MTNDELLRIVYELFNPLFFLLPSLKTLRVLGKISLTLNGKLRYRKSMTQQKLKDNRHRNEGFFPSSRGQHGWIPIINHYLQSTDR